MSRYDDGRTPRGHAADYYTYSAGGASAPPPYPRVPSPGHTTYDGKPPLRLTYEPQDANYTTRSRSRPRSLAPPTDSPRNRTRERRYDGDDDGGGGSDDGKVRSPIDKAKRLLDNTFTDSTTGLGVGVLGALVGGLAAREAVDLTSNRDKTHKSGPADDAEHKRNQLIGTVVGAAVGALGANAVEKRIEVRRARDEVEQRKWERKWRRPEGEPVEVLEKIDVVARPRSRAYDRSRERDGGRDRDRSRGIEDDWDVWDKVERGSASGGGGGGGRGGRSASRRGVSREVDTGVRSWKNVEDWLLLDESDDGRRHRSRDSYRH